MKQIKTLYSFLNWRYELLNLYQTNCEAKNVDLCAVVFLPLAQFTIRADFNIEGS